MQKMDLVSKNNADTPMCGDQDGGRVRGGVTTVVGRIASDHTCASVCDQTLHTCACARTLDHTWALAMTQSDH